MEIKKGYLNKKNEHYDIRNINFDSREDFSKNAGKFICQSTHNDGVWFDTDYDLTNGVYLYKPDYDETKALRIYKDTLGVCNDYKFTAYDDYKIVSELLSRQKNIKLTDFPTGIVTIENFVIGQEIPFYKNSKNLSEIIHLKNHKEIIKYYINIINILEELYNNGIIYSDVHAKNFMIYSCNNLLKLIDFDSKYLSIDNEKKHIYKDMVVNLKNMINFINNKININFQLTNSEYLDEIKKELISKSKKYM